MSKEKFDYDHMLTLLRIADPDFPWEMFGVVIETSSIITLYFPNTGYSITLGLRATDFAGFSDGQIWTDEGEPPPINSDSRFFTNPKLFMERILNDVHAPAEIIETICFYQNNFEKLSATGKKYRELSTKAAKV